MNAKSTAIRMLMLISTPKNAQKAADLFRSGGLPIQYQFLAYGTASSEVLDLLGLGNIDRMALLSVLPKPFADEMLKKLNHALKLEAANGGIAFTVPISGSNSLILHMLHQLGDGQAIQPERKEGAAPMKYVMIAAVVNQGFSEEVMVAARAAGATGGTMLHSHQIVNEETLQFWGLSVQQEKDIVMILADSESKLGIMQAISERCGMHSEAKGIVVSLPVDSVIGLREED